MSKTVFDMWLIGMQVFAACSGLVIIGYLIIKIAKNRRQTSRSIPGPNAAFSETLIAQLVEQQFHKAMHQVSTSLKRGGMHPIDASPLPNHRGEPLPDPVSRPNKKTFLKPGGHSSPLEARYQQAVLLATRGVEPGIIQRRVELPRCEIDLIAKLNGPNTQMHWGTHQPLLEAIELGG